MANKDFIIFILLRNWLQIYQKIFKVGFNLFKQGKKIGSSTINVDYLDN